MATTINTAKPDWRIEISRSRPNMSKIFYKNQQVGLITSISVDVEAGSPLPKVTFTTFLSNVNIQGVK